MTGTLGLFSLVDLFQLLAASSRSGRLTVDHPEGSARVYFEEGLAVHAEFAGYSGEEAVFALFSDEQGSFEFMLGVPAPQSTIETSTESLVLEASRRLDESRRQVGPNEKGPFGEPLSKEEAGQRGLPPRSPPDVGKSANAGPDHKEPVQTGRDAAIPAASAETVGEDLDFSGFESEEPELLHEAAQVQEQAPTREQPPTSGHSRTSEQTPKREQAPTAEQTPSHEQASAREQPQESPRQPAPVPADPQPAEKSLTTGASSSGITLTAIPSFAEKAKTVADMSLSKEEVGLLRVVDGKRNVGQIAQEAGVNEEVARVTVKRFVEAGVLRLSNRKPRTARLVTHLTKVRLPHGIAGVDRSIMSSWEKSLGYPAQNVACRLEDGRVCLLGAMPLDNAGPYLLINRETMMHADLAVNQPLLVKPVPQNEV